MKRFVRFFREYPQFGFALLGLITASGLAAGGVHPAADWVLALSSLILVVPLVWGMIQDVRMGTYGVDLLAATAIVTSVIMHQYWAGMVIVLMLTGGESLEDYAAHRAKAELSALLNRVPSRAHVLRGRKMLDLPASEVVAGDKLAVRPGEVVPVDGDILEGEASFDESSLTGESRPVVRGAGASVLSGSVNLDGALTIRASRVAADSQYEQIIKLVRAAQNSQAPFVRLADRYALPFTAISLAIASGAWMLSHHAIRFLEVLVVATPCPLILAAPIAIISGMSRAAKAGIIVKTGSALERLAEAQTFAFDKTGTLTRGHMQVGHITTFGKHTADEVLAAAASVEQHSNHVLAQAIVQKAAERKLSLPKIKHIREHAGSGMSAETGGRQIVVGRSAFLETFGVAVPKTAASKRDENATSSLVAIGGRLAGAIGFSDELRPESKPTIAQLRALGIKHFLMVTGDNFRAAKAVAKTLGISDVRADALPADKLAAVEKAAERPIAFVGDGVNDAPVLAASDVGIALGARGSTAASESADMVIMLDDLGRVATGTRIARRSFYIARQSILAGIGLSVGLMLIFATGKFRPLYGALIQELVDVIVIFNALRAHRG